MKGGGILEGSGVVGDVLAGVGRIFLNLIEKSGFETRIRKSKAFIVLKRNGEWISWLTFFSKEFNNWSTGIAKTEHFSSFVEGFANGII